MSQDPREWIVYDKDGNKLGRPVEIIRTKWNEGLILHEPGVYEGFDFIGSPAHMDNGHGLQVPVHLMATLDVEQTLFFGFLSVERISGFRDELHGAVITNAITARKLDFEEVEEQWQKLARIEDAPRRPSLILVASDVYEDDL